MALIILLPWYFDLFQDVLNYIFAVKSFHFPFRSEDDAVIENRVGHLPDVIRGHKITSLDRRIGVPPG